MEAALRQAVNYKYKLTAGVSKLHPLTVKKLEDAGIALEQSITDTVKEFYREATKTVVSVDREALERIRREALQTQEKLLVPEDGETASMPLQTTQETNVSVGNFDIAHLSTSMLTADSMVAEMPQGMLQGMHQEALDLSAQADLERANPWTDFQLALTQTEREALLLILSGDDCTDEETILKQFSDTHDIMLEMLADGINEKAVDIVGDSLLDEAFKIYDDYLEQLREALDI